MNIFHGINVLDPYHMQLPRLECLLSFLDLLQIVSFFFYFGTTSSNRYKRSHCRRQRKILVRNLKKKMILRFV